MAKLSLTDCLLIFCAMGFSGVGSKPVTPDPAAMCSELEHMDAVIGDMIQMMNDLLTNYESRLGSEDYVEIIRRAQHPELPTTVIRRDMELNEMLDTLGDTLVEYRFWLLNLINLEKRQPSAFSAIRKVQIRRLTNRWLESVLQFVKNLNGKSYESTTETHQRLREAHSQAGSWRPSRTEVLRVSYQVVHHLLSKIIQPTHAFLQQTVQDLCCL